MAYLGISCSQLLKDLSTHLRSIATPDSIKTVSADDGRVPLRVLRRAGGGAVPELRGLRLRRVLRVAPVRRVRRGAVLSMRGGVLPQPTRVGVRRMRTKHRRSCLARSESCASCDSNDGTSTLDVFFPRAFKTKNQSIRSMHRRLRDSVSQPPTQFGSRRSHSVSHSTLRSLTP